MKKLLIISFLLIAISASAVELRIASDVWEPYEFVEQGKNVGISTDIITEVFKNIDVKIDDDIPTYPWARVELMLNNNSLDAMYTAAYDESRAKLHKYSAEAIVDSSWVLLVLNSKQEQNTFTSLDTLKGKTIGTVTGYKYPSAFSNYIKENCKVEPVNKDDLNLRKLLLERIDYVIMDKYNAQYLLENTKTKGIVILNNVVAENKLYLVFNKQVSDTVIEAFDKELRNFKTTENYKKILGKYLYNLQ